MLTAIASEAGEEGEVIEAKPAEPKTPKKPCSGRFGSFSAQFSDGLCLALSTYGPEGESPDGKGGLSANLSQHYHTSICV